MLSRAHANLRLPPEDLFILNNLFASIHC